MIYKILKAFNFHGFFRIFKKNKLTILCLHRVTDELDFFFNPIKVNNFYNLLTYLSKHYEIIHFSDLKKVASTKNKLILSFDDGYYDFYEIVLPILTNKNIKANHNIVNICANSNAIIWTQKLNLIFNFYFSKQNLDCLENRFQKIDIPILKTSSWQVKYRQCFNALLNEKFSIRSQKLDFLMNLDSIQTSKTRMMNWNEINECVKNNIEIGSHSYSHDNLSLLDSKDLLDFEIKNSIDEINNKLNINCSIVSLPNGKFNQCTLNYLVNLKTDYILKVDDNLSHDEPFYNRLYLIEEPIENMICRTEMLQQKFKKLLKR